MTEWKWVWVAGFLSLAVAEHAAIAEPIREVPTTLRMRKPTKAAGKASARPVAQAPEPTPAPTAEPTPEPSGEEAEPAPPASAPPDPSTPAEPTTAESPAPAEAPTVAETPDLTDEELAALAQAEAEVIVVTGSTIERRELTTAAPVSVLDKADLVAAGLPTVGDIIQNLPAQSNAINAQVNNGGDGATRVNLRGLGTARTLTLLNGRRVVPGGLGADASVDLNAIPLAVIERVEVLKDGASAVYGSDAIGGVVNIITREDFDGTEASLYTGTSQRNDGFSYDMSFVTGHSSQKGNLLFSAGWQRQSPVFAGERNFSRVDRSYDFETGDVIEGGSTATPDGRINTSTIDVDGDGMFDMVDLCGQSACKRNAAGGWDPFVAPDDLYNYQPVNYLYTPSQRYNAYSSGHYKLTSTTRLFFEGLYLNRKSDQQLAAEPFVAHVPISAQSIYNPTGGDVYDFRRRLVEFGPRASFQNIDTFRIVAGIAGKLPEDGLLPNWKWEVSYNYGRTEGLQRNEGNLILSRLANALGPSFVDANGVPHCGTPTAPIPGCVPMNIMGPAGSVDRAARDYVTFTGVSTGFNDQKSVLAQASGRITELPNDGDISIAVGGNYRAQAGGFTPDPLTSTGDTTGNAQAPTGGKFDVIEAFGELSIVPVTKREFAEWVELSLAARGFRYDTFGSGLTWKAGGLFKTIGGVAVRGTYSTAFRSPSVGELFQGAADSFPAAIDPCDTDPDGDGVSEAITNPVTMRRCAEQGVPVDAQFGTAQQRSVIGGNPELEAETAKVLTAGLVIEPPAIKGLSLTLDYFRVNISHAIQGLGGQVILANCYERDQQEACDRIVRDPTLNYAIDFISDPVSNVGGTTTDGIDFALAYDRKLGNAGRFRYQFEGQYLRSYNLDAGLLGENNEPDLLTGVGVYDLGLLPRWKFNFTTLWQRERLNAGFNVRLIGPSTECDFNDCNSEDASGMRVNPERTIDTNVTGDVFLGYTVKTPAGTTNLTVGVNNVTDQDPSLIYIGFYADSDSDYDFMGRYFYARVSQLF